MNILSHVSIKKHLVISFSLIAGSLLVVGAVTLYQMDTLGALTSTLYEHPLRVSNAALKARSGIVRIHRDMKDVALSQNVHELHTALSNVKEDEAEVYRQLAIVKRYILGAEGQALALEAENAFADWEPIRFQVISLIKAGEHKQASKITQEQGARYVGMLERKMDGLTSYARAKADGFMKNALAVQRKITINTVLLLAGMVLFFALVAYVLIQSLLRKINSFQETVSNITETGVMKEVNVSGGDEVSMLARSFNALIRSLQRQFWLREGLSLLSSQFNGARNRKEVADLAINQICRHLDAVSGAVFIYDEAERKSDLFAAYASIERTSATTSFMDGEGVIGQVAGERKAVVLSQITSANIVVESGTDNISPRTLVAIPLLYDEMMLGVLEVLMVDDLLPIEMEFIEEAGGQVATALFTALQRERIDELFDKAKKANAELEKQGEALSAANEQLEMRNEELRMQSEELQTQKSELQSQAVELIQQKAELERKRKQVVEADKLKSEFLSNMSHELRTPLNSILALSQLMMSKGTGKDPVKDSEFLGVIERNGRNLLSLINDILDLSKIESGRMDIFPERFNPGQMLHGIADTIRPLADEKNVHLNIAVEYGGDVVSDRDKIRQIALNLLSNAVKFTDEGSVTASLKQEEEKLVLTVQDTGIGIPAEDIEDIFDEFRQVDGSASRKHEGTGLGLAICKKLAELLGCDLQVDSEPGAGSSFALSIPLTVDEYRHGASHESLQKDEDESEDYHQTAESYGNKILVVDDDADVRSRIRAYLEEAGYSVLEAATGKQALELATRISFDAITLDIVMPEMDGWEVLRQLKRETKNADVPVVIVSVNEDHSTGIALGAGGYVSKPVEPDKLIAELHRVEGSKAVETVLVVDDDEVIRSQIVEILTAEGYATVEAGSGQEGIDKAILTRPDAMILDLMMPGMDGFEVVQHLSSNAVLHAMPVVVVTAKDLTAMEKEQLVSKTRAVLQKGNMDISTLLERLNTELSAIRCADGRGIKQLSAPNVLVVEDNEIAAMQIISVMEELRYVVWHASDGEEAVELVKDTVPDAIVLDLMMPGVDGFEVLEEVRSKPETATIPVVVLTAKELTVEDRKRLSHNNVTELIRKGTLDREQLKQLVKRAVSSGFSVQRNASAAVSTQTASTVIDYKDAGKGKTILVVEDNPDNIITVKAVLDEFGSDVVFAENGEDGVDIASKRLPDVILMDIQLPGMSGLEATRLIKENSLTAKIPVVALTARAMKTEMTYVYDAGCDHLLTKPYAPHELLALLAKILKG